MSLKISWRHTSLLSRNGGQHHCASVCEEGNSRAFWLAFYNGRECTNEQHVVVQYWDEDELLQGEIELGAGTGNPVVFYDGVNKKTILIFSRFTDTDVDGEFMHEVASRPVERWKYCRNYVGELEVGLHDGPQLKNVEEISCTYGLLARISPMQVDQEKWGFTHFIGFYREKDPKCSLWGYDPAHTRLSKRFRQMSEFCQITDRLRTSKWVTGPLGDGVGIQPTFTFFGDSLYAFCRNVARVKGDDRRAWMCVSQVGEKWTTPVQSVFPSHNNSLSFADAAGGKWAVFSTDSRRTNLWLYNLRSAKAFDLRVPDEAGDRMTYSYPNMFVDSLGGLHVVHTSCQKIAWHRFNDSWLKTMSTPHGLSPSMFQRLTREKGQPVESGLERYFREIKEVEDIF